MSFTLTSALTDQLIGALSNTLVYSLLQGVVLAAAAGLIVVFTRKSTAAKRYNMLVGVMVLFAISAAVTFTMEMQHAAKPVVTAVHSAGNAVNNAGGVEGIDQPGQVISHADKNKADVLAAIAGYLNDHHNNIVLIWFMVICVRCIQLATGLQGTYLLKRNKVYAVAADWEQWLQRMADKMGIRQSISLLESGLAKVPMVIGHLKPVILIPVGLLAALSPDQVEAILLHELAHIRRRDYLVNLLQNLVEIVFFFNPAVLWVSQLIKTEREHCCDDMALAQNAAKTSYIRALVSCEEYQQAIPAYAMAFPGQKNHLVDRVKRMVTNRNHSLDTFEKTLLTIGLVAAGLLTTAFSNTTQINKLVDSTKKVISHAAASVIKEDKPASEKTMPDAKPEAEITAPDSPAQEVAVADTTPVNQMIIYNPGQFKDGVEKIITKPNFTTYLYKENGVLYQLNQVEGKLISIQINGETLSADEQTKRKADIDRVLSKIDADAAKMNQKMNTNTAALGKLSGNLNQLSGQLGQLSKLMNNTTSDSVSNKRALPVAPKQRVVAPVQKQPYASPYNSTYPSNAYNADTSNYNKDKNKYKAKAGKYGDNREEIIDDMIKDGLIKSRDNLSFKISTTEFVINYKKQPEDVYQKYRAKYVKAAKKGDWTWMYNYDTEKHTESSTTIDNTSSNK
ncbi:M56 family metallopeptidase [Mucilaginibacter mali]|uniref:M56 family metallopeptidase n=1 Tax=Mucilaginibacter mali TaxID=2740462 RepID=A0A7D4PZI4_9SPHI|nr:M56 family metallopeptidase [Mucilaginibacter mali]QKJ28886.1 M56 family metallopeptidase [Mucilaginibacter mali]